MSCTKGEFHDHFVHIHRSLLIEMSEQGTLSYVNLQEQILIGLSGHASS